MGIMKLNGIDYPDNGGGGGGGTTVIANPQGTPTATLNTVQIGNVIYDLPSGGNGVGIVQVSSARPQDNSVSTTVTITQV